MNEQVNIGRSFSRYAEIAEKINSMRSSEHSETDIANAVNMSITDMRIFSDLFTKAINATILLDTFATYIGYEAFGGNLNMAIIAKTAKELGLPEASVLHKMKEIAKTYLKLDL